jgi:dienelactone hydrolase
MSFYYQQKTPARYVMQSSFWNPSFAGIEIISLTAAMSRTLVIFFVFLLQWVSGQIPGEVSDTVVCRAMPDQTYSLYIPSTYQRENKTGLILFFEPAGRGKLPLSLYKELAEKYSLLLACSNNSRNGSFESSQKAGKAVLADLLQRFTIDTTFIIASGFSGGGRMASFLAMSDTRIRGAIACGSTFPPSQKISPEKKIPYAEVIGDIDMNFLEAINTFDYLLGISNPVVLCVFAGGHDWPPAESYEQAIQWHLYQRGWLSEQQREEYFKMREHQIQKQTDSLQFPIAYRNLRALNTESASDTHKAKADSILKKLIANKEYKKITKKTEKDYALEEKMRGEFATVFNNQVRYGAPDSSYKKDTWEDFNRSVGSLISSRTVSTHQTGLRLNDFAWRFCAEQFSTYEGEQQYRQAILCAKIWTIISPNSPVAFYLAAKAYAYLNDKTASLKYLQQAIDKGFHRFDLLTRERAFSAFSSDPAFLSLVKRIKQ